MTIEQILIARRNSFLKEARETKGALSQQYFKGLADGITEALELMENNTNE